MDSKDFIESFKKRYAQFSNEVCRERRHFLSDETTQFLNDLADHFFDQKFSDDTVITITPEEKRTFYRACAHDYSSTENCYSNNKLDVNRMKPIADVRALGRLNSYNINVLYMADSEGTAISESRANSNAPVSVGTFILKRTIQLIDLTKKVDWWTYLEEHNDPRTILSNLMSEPLDDERHKGRSYIPTQIIAEFLHRERGVDGIIYQSQYSHFTHLPIGPVLQGAGGCVQMNLDSKEVHGKNYCLFDLDAAECIDIDIWHISKRVNHVTKGAPYNGN
jgi:hypothetical protein